MASLYDEQDLSVPSAGTSGSFGAAGAVVPTSDPAPQRYRSKYRLVACHRDDAPAKTNEVRVTHQGPVKSYLGYAMALFEERGARAVAMKGMGRAIHKAVAVTEVLKRRLPGLHQRTEIGSLPFKEVWAPLEEGLNRVESTRYISSVLITLSKDPPPLDLRSRPGYQVPLPLSEVYYPVGGYQRPYSRRGRGGRGRGGRGGGRGGGGQEVGGSSGGGEFGYHASSYPQPPHEQQYQQRLLEQHFQSLQISQQQQLHHQHQLQQQQQQQHFQHQQQQPTSLSPQIHMPAPAAAAAGGGGAGGGMGGGVGGWVGMGGMGGGEASYYEQFHQQAPQQQIPPPPPPPPLPQQMPEGRVGHGGGGAGRGGFRGGEGGRRGRGRGRGQGRG